MDLTKLVSLLEERLVQHDENRKEVQAKLDAIYNKAPEEAASLEDKIGCEIRKEFDSIEEGTLSAIGELNSKLDNSKEGRNLDTVITEARHFMKEYKYAIEQLENAQSFADSYRLTISSVPANEDNASGANEAERVAGLLEKSLEKTHESVVSAQDRLLEICNKRREEAEEMKKRVNGRLGELFTKEDARLQGVLKEVREKIGSDNPGEVREAVAQAEAALITGLRYSLENPANELSLDGYDLTATEEVFLECLGLESRKPANFVPSFSNNGELSLSFAFFSGEEAAFLKPLNLPFMVELTTWEKGNESAAETSAKEYSVGDTKPVCFEENLIVPELTRCMKVRIECRGIRSEWSDVGEITTPEFKELCVWKRFIEDYIHDKMYSVGEENSRIATRDGSGSGYCVIPGNAAVPPNRVVSWDIKVLKSAKKRGEGIFVGVVPFDAILKRDENPLRCGWFFEASQSRLHSGLPHNYDTKHYGPPKLFRKAVKDEINVGVVMDTSAGVLSFSVNNKSYGVAYEGVPLDKPLFPCVFLVNEGDSVEICVSGVEEKTTDISIHAPSSITATSGTTWDSVILTWKAVKGASLYQVETNGSRFLGSSGTNTFTKRGLLADTEHRFRVRTIKGNRAGEWSDVVVGRTQKESFETSRWKNCPNFVDAIYKAAKFFVDEDNPRVASRVNGEDCYRRCTITGNTSLPPNKVTSWNIKILESKRNTCQWIYVGVAPFDINQIDNDIFSKCGWYFYCYRSTLCSGPPHNYEDKKYGPRKGKDGEYVHTGDNIGVVMDTAKGKLSFIVNGVNLGVAFKGIPLDKPLVPCVVLGYSGDSVELVI